MRKGRASPIPGGPTKIGKAVPKLPAAGEEMPLERFDEFYGGLVGGIDERLGQLSEGGADNSGAQQSLPNASVESYASEIDQMSAVQREIRLLTLKLQQAKLAKQVYDEIYPDNSIKYEERIAELEEAIVSQHEEHKEKLAELPEKEQAEQDYNELDMEFGQYQEQAEIKQAEYEERLAELEEIVDFRGAKCCFGGREC